MADRGPHFAGIGPHSISISKWGVRGDVGHIRVSSSFCWHWPLDEMGQSHGPALTLASLRTPTWACLLLSDSQAYFGHYTHYTITPLVLHAKLILGSMTQVI